MDRYVLDTSAVNRIVDTPGAFEALRRAVERGDLDLLYPHVTLDEVKATPDAERRRRLLEVVEDLARPAVTGVFVLGVSKLDRACLTDDAGVVVFDALRSNNLGVVNNRHTHDALVTSSAQRETCAVVANDERLERRATEQNITVLKTEDFLASIGF
jgi:predicted nucleic acid-binding protein